MAQANIPENENERLSALYEYDLLDRNADTVFETIIRIAADVCDVDISVIALIDRDRQFFFARNGMEPQETPRAIAFCAHAILKPESTFEIPDATKDPRFADNPLVTGEIGVRFYAAQPLTTPDGYAIGGLCLIGKEPKSLTESQRDTLSGLGKVIMSLFESRKSASSSEKKLIDAKAITETAAHKLREQQATLSAQNEHFQAALENMNQGLVMFDENQQLIVCNERYASMYYVSHDLLRPGTTLAQIVEHRIAKGIYAGRDAPAYIQERFEWGGDPQVETKIHDLSDGRTVFISRRPLQGGGWVATHEDITEQKRADKALRESEKHFRNLIEGSIQGVFIARNWELLFANQALADIFGYADPGEILDLRDVDPLIAPEERQRIWDYNNARKKGRYAPEVYESRGLKKDGSEFWVEYRVRQVDWHGSSAMQCVVLDVDNRKQAEAELLQHRDHLQELVNSATSDLKAKALELEAALAKEKELNELQRQFVSMASHEFRTPLAIIDSTAQRLKKKAGNLSSEDTLKRVDKIRSAVNRMTRLMEDTLTAARVDEGKIAVEIKSCNVGQVISDACWRLQEIAKDHVISCDICALPETIRADAGALDQVITNLLSNAVKYAPGAPDIQVTAHSEGDYVLIQVQDHGLGIDEDDLPKLFERFFRAKTSAGIAGTGIGLKLVKTLVEMHDGSISIDSRKDVGSTFTVRLPVNGPPPGKKAA